MTAGLGMIDLKEAVRRALNSEHYVGTRTPGAARAWVRRLADSVGDDPTRVARNGTTWLHPSLHPALSEIPIRERIAVEITSLPQGKRNRGLAKLKAVQDFEAFRRGPGRGLGKTLARVRFINHHQRHYVYHDGSEKRVLTLSVRSLQKWETQYAQGGADALARDGRGRGSGDGPSEDAVRLYWALRADPRRLTIRSCCRITSLEAAKNRWTWFKTYAACIKWDNQNRNDRALTLNQQGDLRYVQRCGRYIELDPESFEPGQAWIGDDSTINVWVQTPGGKVIRPTISAWLDWRTRTVVGFRVAHTGTEHGLLLGFGDAASAFGLPATVIVDNGRNYSSWQWRGDVPKYRTYRKAGELAEQVEGIFNLCGIRPSWALPYNPNAKARLERWFRTLDEQFCKAFPSYCGKAPDDRPDAHVKLVKQAAPWDAFVGKLTEYIKVYNNTPHTGEGMEHRTPLQAMALASRKRVLDDNLRPLLLAAWHRPVSVGRNGVALRICGTTIRYGAADPAIQALSIGTKVRVAYDPQDVQYITVWSMDYAFIAQVEMNQRLNRSLPAEGLRETMREIASEKRALRQAYKVGTNHLRNPVERAIAALQREANERRLPDPPHPDGGPVLVPVQTPLEPPSKQQQIRRKAVGAEGMDDDAMQRFEAFVNRRASQQKGESVYAALERFLERDGGR